MAFLCPFLVSSKKFLPRVPSQNFSTRTTLKSPESPLEISIVDNEGAFIKIKLVDQRGPKGFKSLMWSAWGRGSGVYAFHRRKIFHVICKHFVRNCSERQSFSVKKATENNILHHFFFQKSCQNNSFSDSYI